jgi:hypothetical protein
VGFYVAIMGAIVVALSHRKPPVSAEPSPRQV